MGVAVGSLRRVWGYGVILLGCCGSRGCSGYEGGCGRVVDVSHVVVAHHDDG